MSFWPIQDIGMYSVDDKLPKGWTDNVRFLKLVGDLGLGINLSLYLTKKSI